MAAKNGLYKQILDKKASNKYIGYKYQGRILSGITSSALWNGNKTLRGFLESLENVITETYESIKRIKCLSNIARDEYDTNFN